ncbi:hypothetical protein [Bordetella bronchiseptica]|uniref:hypothetical protein n=1 Tax=Bordetella bronchiseptica TaxID=518 RepID=UPI000FD9CCAD|nr:hypothetical protein [Bordetella bronchiseptica]
MTNLVPNRPSPEGRIIGAQLARLTDQAESALLVRFHDHPRRCKSCAFTAGTVPNGCLLTVMDALKATMEMEPFYCHQPKLGPDGKPTTICAGWSIAISALVGNEPLPTPWEYSHEESDTSARKEGDGNAN